MNATLNYILSRTNQNDLIEFVKQYAQTNADFAEALQNKFSPKPKKNSGEKKENYEKTVRNAFLTEPPSRGRYYRYDDYNDDDLYAQEIAEELRKLLDKATYYIQYQDYDEALNICKAIISIMPYEWNPNYDYDGEVQIIYDLAIDAMQQLLEENKLNSEQKNDLFRWYLAEVSSDKHEGVGLNTDLSVLEEYYTDTDEGYQLILNMLDSRINNAPSDYDKERHVVRKTNLLLEHNDYEQFEKITEQYIAFPEIRKILLNRLRAQEKHKECISLIKGGIEIAKTIGYLGTAYDWKEELLTTYQHLGYMPEARQLCEELTLSRGGEKHYALLKQITPEEEWNDTLNRLLAVWRSGREHFFGSLYGKVLIENNMWDELWDKCKKYSIRYIVEYEKHLKPHFENEMLIEFRNHVIKQAIVTDQKIYSEIADYLKKMRQYKGGNELVNSLIAQFRVEYKRRPRMMQELDKV